MATTKGRSAGSKPKTKSSSSPYHQAATFVNELLWPSSSSASRRNNNMRRSLKSLVYDNHGNMLCSKSCYAQVCNVIQHQAQLEYMLDSIDLGHDDTVSNQALLYVLTYELILGPKQRIAGGGAVKRLVVPHETALRQAAAVWRRKNGSGDAATNDSVNGRIQQQQHARYIRVNTLKTTTQQVVKRIQSILQLNNDNDDAAAAASSSSTSNVVYLDPHVPDLLVVSPQATSHLLADPLLNNSNDAVVWQDKSSCFSALCLAEGWCHSVDGDYIDACAAPGNKTLHLAALLEAKRKRLQLDTSKRSKTTMAPTTIYALDRSGDRHGILQQRIQQYFGKDSVSQQHVKVVPLHQDCLAIKPEDYPNVRSVLLDPTCSGSGVISNATKNAMTHHHAADTDDGNDVNDANSSRISSLSNFQVTCLKQFMSFPHVDRIVYSTCSVHATENESVIAQVLAADYGADWAVHAPLCLTHWPRRGVPTEGLTPDQIEAMIRVDPYQDGTNGFFVCCLERRQRVVDDGEVVKSDAASCVDPVAIRIQNQQLELGIPLYNGEFGQSMASSAANVSGKTKGKAPAKRDSLAPVPSVPAPATTVSAAAKEPPKKKKKVFKKNDWKRQQREAKQRRLEQKNTAKPAN